MKFNKEIKINSKIISEDNKVFIIAEAGVNHNGDINIAKRLIDIACDAKVDAIKFQAFKTEELILKNVDKASYQIVTTNKEESQYEMLKKLEITKEQNKELKKYCDCKGIIFLTTPFDEKSLIELDELNLPAYKVASTDITNIPFLKDIAKRKKPIFLSTGMSYLEEIKIALKEIQEINSEIVLLQCTANYPINDNEVNLNVIDTFKREFDILLGYSDHTVGIGAAPYSVAKGVKVIEKHFTINKSYSGPDHKASLDPQQLKTFVEEIRKVEKYLGTYIKIPTCSEMRNRQSLQKCLVAQKKIEIGEEFNEKNIIAKRTGGKGISPIYYKEIIGTISKKQYYKDDIIVL